MGVKRSLRSSFAKFAESSASKGNKPLLGGDENPSIEEQWIIPSFFEDYLLDKSLDWNSTPCSEDLPYTVCKEPNDLLTMDLELKHIPRLGTCSGDFAPTIDVVFKSHTSVSKGWRSWCRRGLAHPPFMDILQKVKLVETILVFSNLEISKDSESLLFLLYRWNFVTHTFFIGCQEISISLEDVYEILRLALFGDGEVVNISLSPNGSKTVKFLEDAVKKTLKKLVLKAARKGNAPSNEVLEDTSVNGDKGSRANFLGWIRYFWREYADGVDEEANGDSLKEGIDFVVGEGNCSSYELEAFIAFLLSCHLFEGYPHEKILSRHFPLAIKLARGQSFPFAPYFLGTLYSHLDNFTLDLQRSWDRFQVEIFVPVAFLQIWLWEHSRNYAPVPKVLSSYKTSLPLPQGLPHSWHWNKVAVSSNSFLGKVLNDPTGWTSRPYSALKGGLSPLFTSLENISISRYRDTS